MLDIGQDLQFIGNPSEAFPALMLGGPWGIEDASCPNRPNPPVPSWHASARYRFQVGLADDLLGYLKPAWSFLFDTPGFFTPTDCTNDPHGHSHSLEDESVGWTAGNLVAEELTDLLDDDLDPTAGVRLGRYIKADGSLTDTTPIDQVAPGHFPAGAVAIWLASTGETTLNATPGQPDSGTIVALGSVGSFGSRAVDANGEFMDFDGAEDSTGPGLMTRGMLVRADNGSGMVQKRYFVDVYPALTVTGSLGSANPPAADLSVTLSDDPDPVPVGGLVTYTATVTNAGPNDARDVNLTDVLPKSMRLRSARSDNGRCVERRPRRVECNLADLASGESALVTIRVRGSKAGTFSNVVTVRAGRPSDPVLVNNAATETTTVTP